LKFTDFYAGIGFAVSWKRRKKKNNLEPPPFYGQKANKIVASVEKREEKGLG